MAFLLCRTALVVAGSIVGAQAPDGDMLSSIARLEASIRQGGGGERARAVIRRVMEAHLAAHELAVPSLALPFRDGRWRITQGNSTPYSHSGKNQFSWDFELVDREGFRHPLGFTPTERPKESYSYGQPVYAVRAGRVWIQDGGQDGGEKSNLIVIHHGDGTRAIYDHIRPDGFACNTGDTVEGGQLIGFVGYTGVSYPHIHFAIRHHELDDWTLPVRFSSYYLIDPDSTSARQVQDGVPLEGEIIAATRREAENPSIPAKHSVSEPDDTAHFRGHRYKYFGHRLDRESSELVCERLGGHLVSITSRAEDRFVAALLPSMGKYDRCWIGLKRSDDRDDWQWVTGERFQYANWGKWQPDNRGGAQHFGQIGFAGGKQWCDGAGSERHAFICEWE